MTVPYTPPILAAATWFPPPQGTFKVNVDAHVMEGVGVSFRVAIRDAEGKLVVAAVKRIDAVWAPDMAEAGTGWTWRNSLGM